MCTCVTDRDLESGCLVCNGSRKRPDVTRQRSTTPMTTLSTHRSGAMDVGWLASGPLSCHKSQTRDGDKSKLRDKGILKAVFHIIDVIAHKLLGMDVWDQAEIDRTMVETLDGTKNERCWSRANSSANATLAISMTVYRASTASEVSLYTYISTHIGKSTDKFVMPISSFNVVCGGSRAGNCLAYPEFLTMPTGAGSVAEDMITDTESFYTLKSDHQEDVRRGACNVGDETGFAPSVRLNNETLGFLTGSCHVANEESLHVFGLPDSQECPVQHCAETLWSEKRFT